MAARRSFVGTTIGKKTLMAVTGIILLGWILLHMLGNLQIFRGAAVINGYSALLHAHAGLLWTARVILFVAAVVHIAMAWQLKRLQRAQRPVQYQRKEPQASSVASRTMGWGGIFILLFVIYHLLDMTFGTVHPGFIPGDVYHNMVGGLAIWWVALIYLAAMVALGLHLYHGTWSVFQTLGINQSTINPFRRRFATVVAVVIYAGFTVIPLAILLGYGR